MILGGEIIVLDNVSILQIIDSIDLVIKNDLLKKNIAKTIAQNTKDSLVDLSSKMAIMQESKCFIRISKSPEATHNSYFECVTVKKDGRITKAEALADALNMTLYQSKESAEVGVVYSGETDRYFEFVISVKQY